MVDAEDDMNEDDDWIEDEDDEEEAETTCPSCEEEQVLLVTCSECGAKCCEVCEANDDMGRPLNPPLCETCGE